MATIPAKPALEEVQERTRRIETRLTQLMIGLGVNTKAQRPAFAPATDTEVARMQVPSPHISLREISSAIPAGCVDDVHIFVGDDYVGRFQRG